MLETPDEIGRLQQLLDHSAAGAGPHLRGILTDERRLTAAQLTERLPGMRLLVVATVTADGRPLAGPVDGYFLHGSFWFSSGRNSVRMRHLAARPAVSATHLPGEELAVTVHGRAELFDLRDPVGAELRQAMLDWYVPRQGPEFETWLDQLDAVGARIAAEKMFTFSVANLGGMDDERAQVPEEFWPACGRPGSRVVVRHVPVTIPHALCDLTGVALSYPGHGGATVHATPATIYSSLGFRLTVHPGTLDVTVDVRPRPTVANG